jgi:hypothetical protein
MVTITDAIQKLSPFSAHEDVAKILAALHELNPPTKTKEENFAIVDGLRDQLREILSDNFPDVTEGGVSLKDSARQTLLALSAIDGIEDMYEAATWAGAWLEKQRTPIANQQAAPPKATPPTTPESKWLAGAVAAGYLTPDNVWIVTLTSKTQYPPQKQQQSSDTLSDIRAAISNETYWKNLTADKKEPKSITAMRECLLSAPEGTAPTVALAAVREIARDYVTTHHDPRLLSSSAAKDEGTDFCKLIAAKDNAGLKSFVAAQTAASASTSPKKS